MGYAVDFDGQLYNGLSIGKAEAFASVFDRYHRLLYALAYRYLKSGPEAEDAVQHTFMRLWEQRETFDFSEMRRVEIPLPPIEFQHSIADVYNCLQESKRIVQESRELMKELCPALVQKAAHSA